MIPQPPSITISNGIARFDGGSRSNLVLAAMFSLLLTLFVLVPPIVALTTADQASWSSHAAIAGFWVICLSPIFYFLHGGTAKSTIEVDLRQRMMRITSTNMLLSSSTRQFPLANIAAIELAFSPDFDGPPVSRPVLRLKDGEQIKISQQFYDALFPTPDAWRVREGQAAGEDIEALLRSAEAGARPIA